MKSAYASFGAAAPRGPLEGRTVVERNPGPDPPPMALMLAAVFAGLVAGAASAKLLHDAAPPAAWIVAAASCGALFALGRTLAGRPPSRALLLALLALAFLTFGLLLIAGGESVPRPARRGGIGFAASFALLLAWAGAAVAVPAAIVLAALGLCPPWRSRGRPSGAAAALVAIAPAAATTTAGILVFAAVLWTSPPQWRLAAMIAAAIGSPFVLAPLWILVHLRLAARWQAARCPEALADGLERLREHTGVRFDRIVCLDARFAAGRVCHVVAGFRRSTLVMSASIPETLAPDHLLALLAHEAAHPLLDHRRRTLIWSVCAAGGMLLTAVALLVAVQPWIPRPLELAGIFLVVLPLAIARGLFETRVVRRHEAEADAFAVGVAGAAPLVGALEALGAEGFPPRSIHIRWTTHGTWEERKARIEAMEERG